MEKGEGGVDPAASASRSPGIISFGADDGGGAMVGRERERGRGFRGDMYV